MRASKFVTTDMNNGYIVIQPVNDSLTFGKLGPLQWTRVLFCKNFYAAVTPVYIIYLRSISSVC